MDPLNYGGHPAIDCLNGPSLASFFVYFCVFKKKLQFFEEMDVKNFHPVYDAGVQTHNLQT